MWKLVILTVFITALVQDATSENISRSRRTLRKPSITSIDDEFTVVKGEDVTLPCNVKNLGHSYVIWKKDATDIMKIKKMGRHWKIHPPHSSLYKKYISTGDMSLDGTSLILHTVDADDQGKYLCTIENEDIQVKHTVKIIDSEDDYYDYDYYENYEDLFATRNEDEHDSEDKNGKEASVSSMDVEDDIIEVHDNEYNIEEGNDRDESVAKNESSKSPSNKYNSDDDYYDYYEDLFESTEDFETTIMPQSEEVSTTKVPTMTPTAEPTKPARTWNWSFWGSGPKTGVTTTATSTPTTSETPKTIREKEFTGSITQVTVGRDGMASLACTLPLPDGDEHQVHIQWMHNNKAITPDGESIVELQDGDMNTLLITSVEREDIGEYRCIVGEEEAVIKLVAFPPKPVYKMVDENYYGSYELTWEAKGLVSIDSYSIIYRERGSSWKYWQLEGPFKVSEPSSIGSYSHTFHNLKPYTDYEAIVSTIYQDMATTGDPFPFSVKRTGDMYPSSRKPGNGLVRAWMKQPAEASKDQTLELVCIMDTKRRTKVQWFHGKNPETPVEDNGRITSYQKGNNNILRFTSVEPSDLGEYRCQGQTPTGIMDATMQLVAFPPPANKQEIKELDSGIYMLKWESKGLAPVTSFSITYRKNDSTSEGWNQIGPILVNDEENSDTAYSYVFTNLQPSSSYEVIISTIYRDLATTRKPFSFTTKDDSNATSENISRSRRTYRKPSITSTDDEFTLDEGEDVTLPCKVKNLGHKRVIWKKDDTDIIKIKKMGRQWKIHPPHSSYKKYIDTGDISLDETSLTLHSVDADDQGIYLCTIENEDIQVEHIVKIIDSEDDYYNYDYYENYEDLFGTEDEDEPENKDKNGNEASVSPIDVEEEIKEVQINEYKIDEDTNTDESIPKNENSKSPPNEYESEDDYYDYYKDIFGSTDKDKTQVEDPEEVETTILPQSEEVSTTETSTMASTPELTKPARTWNWSFWGSGPKTEVTSTTMETPTTEKVIESIMESDNDQYMYNYNDYDNGYEEDKKYIVTGTIVDGKNYKEDESTNRDESITKNENSKSPPNEYESDDDYYDYYEDIFGGTDKGKTQVEDPEELEFTILTQTEEVSTTKAPTMAPTPESTKPVHTWNWSFWGSGSKTEVTTTTTTTTNTTTTTTTETPTTEKKKEEDSYGHQVEKHTILPGSISQVSVGKNGMACLACTLPLPDGDAEQVHVEWRHNNETITPDGESVFALRDDDLNTLLITSVKREDLGEYRCIVGEDEGVINLVAFPPKPVYKMVDKTSDGNYQITWEAKGLVSMDSYSITYRERDSPLKWWQQEGPFEVSEPSSVGNYSHTFRNLQPYTDYEAIVSTIYQGMATTGDPFPFYVKRTGDMYPSSRKPGNGLVRAWMKQPAEASKDQALELVCTMDTKRRTKVQWFHGKNPETPVEDKHRISSFQKGNNNILRFTSVEPSDLGEYRCQGQTPTGIKEATVQLVAFPPQANKQEITELDSGIYKLKWESKGLAPVTSFSITYRKTDSTSEGWNQIGPILINDEENTDDTHSYVFTKLQPSSSYDVIISTIYRDLATTGEPFSFTTKDDPLVQPVNKHHYSSAPQEQAPISYPSMNDMGQVNVWMEQPLVHVDIGASSQLVCVTDEQQDIQVEWYHGHQKVNTDNNRSISKENIRSILKFMSVSSLDLGTYQCSASNKFGRATAFARLTTTDDADSLVPPQGVLRSEDVTQWWSLTQSIFSDVHKYLKTLTRIPQPTELGDFFYS